MTNIRFFNSAAGWKHENGSTVAEMSENFFVFLLEISVAEISSLKYESRKCL